MSDKESKTRAGVKPALVSFEELHQKAVQDKQDYYVDSATGYLVMTSFFLKNRGYCCDNKCRHCPYTKKV
jgi:hypothetical protein